MIYYASSDTRCHVATTTVENSLTTASTPDGPARSSAWSSSGSNSSVATSSGDDLGDDACGFDSGQPGIEALEFECQALVVNTQQVQQRGVEITHVHRVVDDVVAEFAGLAEDFVDSRPVTAGVMQLLRGSEGKALAPQPQAVTQRLVTHSS